MKVRTTFQFLGVGVVGFVLGGILVASAIGADAKGAMTLRRPAVGIIGFGCVVVGGCCLLAGVASGVSSVFDKPRKKDEKNNTDSVV